MDERHEGGLQAGGMLSDFFDIGAGFDEQADEGRSVDIAGQVEGQAVGQAANAGDLRATGQKCDDFIGEAAADDLNTRGGGVRAEFGGRAGCQEDAMLHEGDVRTQRLSLAQIVGRKEDRCPLACGKVNQIALHCARG